MVLHLHASTLCPTYFHVGDVFVCCCRHAWQLPRCKRLPGVTVNVIEQAPPVLHEHASTPVVAALHAMQGLLNKLMQAPAAFNAE